MLLVAGPFLDTHLAEYRQWHMDDALSRRASYPDDRWYRHATSDASTRGLAAFCVAGTSQMVSLAQFDIDNGALFPFIAVRPDLRGKGYGTATLENLIASAPPAVDRVVAEIETDNHASLAMARGIGFHPVDCADCEAGFGRWQLTL